MSGVQLLTRMDWDEARTGFLRLERAVADTTPTMRAIGTGMVASTQDRIDDETTPDGSAFARLNPAYAASKRGTGILRESAMRGGLQGSITHLAQTTSVTIGTNKIYGAIHQFGGTDERPMTARPYLGISSDDREMIVDVITRALARAIGSGPSSSHRR